MKKYLQTLLILLLLIAIPGCNTKQETKTNEPITGALNESPKPAVKQEIRLIPKSSKAEYLHSNAIEFSNIQSSVDTPKGKANCSFLQVSGLKNKAVENRINKSITEDIKDSIISYIDNTNENRDYFSASSELNTNNLLSISITSYDFNFLGGLLYRITDGKRIYLKDIFTEGTDYVSLINRKIIEKIIGGYEDESDILREPFSTISPDQNFVLSNSSLIIIFHRGQAGFVYNHNINIPLAEIDDYINILDTQYLDKDIFENPHDTVKNNNIFINNVRELVHTQNGGIYINYSAITGMDDKSLEDSINDFISSKIDEVLYSGYINRQKPSAQLKGNGDISMYVVFNSYGYLCISRSCYLDHPDFNSDDAYMVYTLNLKNGALVDAKDMISKYAEENKDFKLAFTKAIKDNLKKQHAERNPGSTVNNKFNERIDKTIDYSFIMDNCLVFFQSTYYYFPEPGIVVYFKKDLIGDTPETSVVSFYKDMNILPEAFFQ